MIKHFLCYVFLLFHLNSKAQYDTLADQVHKTVTSAVNTFKENDFYFIGQGHGNIANALLEKEFLFALDQKYGVRYEILEYGHSLAVIFNEYLESGNDRLLHYVSPGNNFTLLLKAVKHFNDSADEQHRVKFYGIDFEGRLNNKFLKKAMEIILAHTKPGKNTVLYNLMSKLLEADSVNTKKILLELKNYLQENEVVARRESGRFYTDLLLIANARYGFVPRRDDEMYATFNLLYRELRLVEPQPRFFASFGSAHLHPKNKGSITRRLLTYKDSPVYGKVSLTGAEYFNCSFMGNIKRTWAGSLDPLCGNKALNSLKTQVKDDLPGVYFLTADELISLDCDPLVQKFNGIVFIWNTGNAF